MNSVALPLGDMGTFPHPGQILTPCNVLENSSKLHLFVGDEVGLKGQKHRNSEIPFLVIRYVSFS